MKLFKTYGCEADAYIDKGLLEDNGINCVVTSNAVSDIFPAPNSGVGISKLFIDEDKEHLARLLIEIND